MRVRNVEMSTTNTQTQRSPTFLESIPVRDLLEEHAGFLVIGKREGSLAILEQMNKPHRKIERRKNKSQGTNPISRLQHTDKYNCLHRDVIVLLLSSFWVFGLGCVSTNKKNQADSILILPFAEFFLLCASAQLLSPFPVGFGPVSCRFILLSLPVSSCIFLHSPLSLFIFLLLPRQLTSMANVWKKERSCVYSKSSYNSCSQMTPRGPCFCLKGMKGVTTVDG